MIKHILENFLPWILFFALAGKSQGQLDAAIICAAVASIYFERQGLRKGFVLSWGTLIFFIFMFIAVVVFKNQWVAQHAWLFSNGALAAIAWISVIIRKPFTLQYAKEITSPEKWNHPVFIKINDILTMVWGAVFLAGLGLHIVKLLMPTFTGWTFELTTYLPSIFGVWFTTRFPAWYRDRQLNARVEN